MPAFASKEFVHLLEERLARLEALVKQDKPVQVRSRKPKQEPGP